MHFAWCCVSVLKYDPKIPKSRDRRPKFSRYTRGYLRATMGYLWVLKIGHLKVFVKLREREGQGVDPGRSLKGHLWMVDGGWWYTFP